MTSRKLAPIDSITEEKWVGLRTSVISQMDREGKIEKTKMTFLKPFKMPKHEAQYMVLEKEWKKQERRRQRTLKVHEKGLKPEPEWRRVLLHDIEKQRRRDMRKHFANKKVKTESDESLKLEYDHVKSSREYVERQKEMFRLRYIRAQQDERIKHLQEMQKKEDAELTKAENLVTEKAFLKYVEEEVHKVETAEKIAEEQKMTLRTVTEQIKNKKVEIKELKRDIAKFQEMIALEKECEEALFSLSPPEWQKEQKARKQRAEKIRASFQTPPQQPSLGLGRRGSVVLPPLGTASSMDPNQRSRRRSSVVLPPLGTASSKVPNQSYKKRGSVVLPPLGTASSKVPNQSYKKRGSVVLPPLGTASSKVPNQSYKKRGSVVLPPLGSASSKVPKQSDKKRSRVVPSPLRTTSSKVSNKSPRRRSSVVLPPLGTTSSKVPEQSCLTRTKTQEQEQGIVGNPEFYEKPQIYFTDPAQLLKILEGTQTKTDHLFEEKERVENLLEYSRKRHKELVKELKKEHYRCKKEIEFLTEDLFMKKQTAKELQEKLEHFKTTNSFQENKRTLDQLHRKIQEVYNVIPGADPDVQTTREMVIAIERFMCEKLEEFNKLPELEQRRIMRKYKLEKATRDKKEKALRAIRRTQEQQEMREQGVLQTPKKKETFHSHMVKSVPVENWKAGLIRKREEEEFLT